MRALTVLLATLAIAAAVIAAAIASPPTGVPGHVHVIRHSQS